MTSRVKRPMPVSCVFLTDYLRRHRVLLIIAGVISFALLSIFFVINTGQPRYAFNLLIIQYYSCVAFIMPAYAETVNSASAASRLWRTLPISENKLANLLWANNVVVLSLTSLVATIAAIAVAVCLKGLYFRFFWWGFVIVLFSSLFAGTSTFFGVAVRGLLVRSARARTAMGIQCALILLLFVFALTITCYVLIMMSMNQFVPLVPPEERSSIYAGIVLALILTAVSYRMRVWLVGPIPPIADRAPKPTSLEDVPRFYASPTALMRQEWIALARSGVTIVTLGGVITYSLANFIRTALRTLQPLSEDFPPGVTCVVLVTIATLLIVSQLQRSLALKLYRALPLSNMGCVLLIMSYPVVRISAVTPFMGAMLWFAGLEHILTFLLTWTFTTLGLAPLFLLLMVRNPVVGTLMSALLVAPGVLGLLLAADKGLLSPTVCWVDVLVCTTLGFGAFWGLYYTVKNSSTAYRQPFVR